MNGALLVGSCLDRPRNQCWLWMGCAKSRCFGARDAEFTAFWISANIVLTGRCVPVPLCHSVAQLRPSIDGTRVECILQGGLLSDVDGISCYYMLLQLHIWLATQTILGCHYIYVEQIGSMFI